SIYEPLRLSNLQRDDEPLWEKLDRYYSAVKTTILNYQSPTTGLFPIKTCPTCKDAKVRDSLYCAAGSWALAMAYSLLISSLTAFLLTPSAPLNDWLLTASVFQTRLSSLT
ncbi:Phosphorylase b kinase regulatory subunit beta, partial [Oryzias melastigma]